MTRSTLVGERQGVGRLERDVSVRGEAAAAEGRLPGLAGIDHADDRRLGRDLG
ncbi:MAG: hypothetical protein JW751_30060 [Polyangiaceae bacterium]|nr:hypothetical protein [Polyangiaceae bacterium]